MLNFNPNHIDESLPLPTESPGESLETPGASELSDLWSPDETSPKSSHFSIEEQLFQQGCITTEQLEQARSIHTKTPRKRLGQILLDMGVVGETELLSCIALQYDLPFVRIDRTMIDSEVVSLLESAFIESHRILPIKIENDKLVVATSDPTDVFLLDEVRRKTGKHLVVQVCPAEDINQVINDLKDNTNDLKVDSLIQDISEDDVEILETQEDDVTDLEQAASDSPIIKFVNYLIFNAVKEGASDIHMEPGDKKFKIRYRIDGVLFESINPPHSMQPAVVSRIKIMANMDIAERRLPQDGRIRVLIHGRGVDMRVSTMPTSHGEKVVIRIMDLSQTKFSLADLGMEEDTVSIINAMITQPYGILLVTGPTGSGKSTTLYSCLRCMDIARLNISTVEDPVEYQLDGVSQVQVHDRIGMSFAAALRSLLRQDPDVVMIGEIRDMETATIAVQASLTGHLVLSTLHTNDAPSSITRLINIGVEPFLIAASTNGVLAQRLVRKICSHCKEPYTPEPEYVSFLEMYGFNVNELVHGTGCEHCRHTGFQGRIGLYELLVIDDTYRDIITNNPTVTELRRLCKERGMVTLRDDGFQKVQRGLTTVEEVMRVTAATV